MRKKFDIPCPSHLRQFAEAHFFEGMKPPYNVTERDLFGKQLLFLLIDRRTKNPEVDLQQFEAEDFLSVELSDTLAKRSPSLLKLRGICRWLDEHFKDTMYTWVMAQVKMGESRYSAAKNFFENHRIVSENVFDTHYTYLKRRTNRSYRRYKQWQKN